MANSIFINLFGGFAGASSVGSLTVIGPGTGVTLTNGSTSVLNLAGSLVATGSLNSGASITLPNAALLFWTTRTVFGSSADGKLEVTNNAVTSGFGLDGTTDGTMNVRTRGQADTAVVNASRFSSGANLGVVTFGPSVVTSITVKGGLVTAIS